MERKKLLIADDSEMNRAILANMLESDYEIIEVSDGQEALSALQTFRGELAALLVSEGKAVLRTSYDIDDEVFYEIATNAANTAGKRVRGFYWMGVIHLEE